MSLEACYSFKCGSCKREGVWDEAVCEVIYYCPDCGEVVEAIEEIKKQEEVESDLHLRRL